MVIPRLSQNQDLFQILNSEANPKPLIEGKGDAIRRYLIAHQKLIIR